MIVSGVILFSVIYSGQMVSAAQRVETYKDNGEDESEKAYKVRRKRSGNKQNIWRSWRKNRILHIQKYWK